MRINRKNGRLRVAKEKDHFNPMEGMANLADVMLVFACGLIVALIFNWNVDVNTGTSNIENKNKVEIDGIDSGSETETTLDEDSEFEEMGTVYKDAKTGKYYIVEEGDE